ncbi:hypothetical protein Dip518_001250 [Parelusimicrobium proximum]|uniref:hypothetical protein n=1 Tax=Parelusimicrobium proximum TaxID=3228953 RepID=UPI003D167F7C
MKKLLLLCSVLLASAGICAAQDFEGIYNNYQVVLYPHTGVFATGGMAESRIVLTKKTTSGSGSYSEYYLSDGQPAFALGSNFEFVKAGRLIAVHNADLTFYEVKYKKGDFKEKKLSVRAVQKLFPDAKILKMSKFKKGVYELPLKDGKPVKILLVNDTKRSFYRYSFMPAEIKKTDVAGLIEVDKPMTITFSHFQMNNKDYPLYTIKVK